MALIVTRPVIENRLVDTVKVPVAEPPGIVILAGTLAINRLLLVKEIAAPPVGAGPLSVTVAVAGVPRETLVGFNDSEDRAIGVMVSEAVLVTPL